MDLPWNRRGSQLPKVLPIPPLEYRQWVGPTDIDSYDNPERSLVYPEFSPDRYESVFDFGCGCGRVARQLILQVPRPRRYVGVDVHPQLVTWCRENLQPVARGFEFHHHDVFDKLVNAGDAKPDVLPFAVPDESVTFFEALSIFTHIVERQLAFYLREATRVLRRDGEMNASFLLFDKADFPVLGPNRNALYVDDSYAPSAVYYDRHWLQGTLEEIGLAITRVTQAPAVRGYQWRLGLARTGADVSSVELPRDEAEQGIPGDLARRWQEDAAHDVT
jgi:SAM-dependent methyltransferase